MQRAASVALLHAVQHARDGCGGVADATRGSGFLAHLGGEIVPECGKLQVRGRLPFAERHSGVHAGENGFGGHVVFVLLANVFAALIIRDTPTQGERVSAGHRPAAHRAECSAGVWPTLRPHARALSVVASAWAARYALQVSFLFQLLSWDDQ